MAEPGLSIWRKWLSLSFTSANISYHPLLNLKNSRPEGLLSLRSSTLQIEDTHFLINLGEVLPPRYEETQTPLKGVPLCLWMGTMDEMTVLLGNGIETTGKRVTPQTNSAIERVPSAQGSNWPGTRKNKMDDPDTVQHFFASRPQNHTVSLST